MTFRFKVIATFVGLLLPVPSLSAVGPAIVSRPLPVSQAMDSTLRAEVQKLNDAMVTAFDQNPADVARFYADSARIVGPRRETVKGRAAIDRYWSGIRKPATWTLEVIDVGGSREEAYQIGVSSLTSTGSDGKQRSYVCDFVVIWKRQPDGTLRIVLDLYN